MSDQIHLKTHRLMLNMKNKLQAYFEISAISYPASIVSFPAETAAVIVNLGCPGDLISASKASKSSWNPQNQERVISWIVVKIS